jgi:hypothetical protein
LSLCQRERRIPCLSENVVFALCSFLSASIRVHLRPLRHYCPQPTDPVSSVHETYVDR